MLSVNKVKLLLERTSGVPLVIFNFIDVTLVDEATNPIPTDESKTAILVTNFATDSGGAN